MKIEGNDVNIEFKQNEKFNLNINGADIKSVSACNIDMQAGGMCVIKLEMFVETLNVKKEVPTLTLGPLNGDI